MTSSERRQFALICGPQTVPCKIKDSTSPDLPFACCFPSGAELHPPQGAARCAGNAVRLLSQLSLRPSYNSHKPPRPRAWAWARARPGVEAEARELWRGRALQGSASEEARGE